MNRDWELVGLEVPPDRPMAAAFERRLWSAAHAGDSDALEQLVGGSMLFALGQTNRYAGLGLGQADLFQEACVGLMLAARRTAPRHRLRFRAAATLWIRRTITQALRSSTGVRRPKPRRPGVKPRWDLMPLERQELSADLLDRLYSRTA